MDRKLAKIESDLLRRVSLLLCEIRDPRVASGLVSVSRAQISRDLRVLKCYVTINTDEEGQRSVMQALLKARRFVRGRLAESVELRHVPEVRFYLDDSPERARRIEVILDGIGHGERSEPIEPPATGEPPVPTEPPAAAAEPPATGEPPVPTEPPAAAAEPPATGEPGRHGPPS
jgi:ribosome-binding factor A